MQKAKDLLS